MDNILILWIYIAWIFQGSKVSDAEFVSITCEDCEQFTTVFHFDETVDTSNYVATQLCTHECTFTTSPLGDTIYIATHRYNQNDAVGSVEFDPPDGMLPPPSSCFLCPCSPATCVLDDEAPIFSNEPDDISQETDAGKATAMVTWTLPTITDNVPDKCQVTFTSTHDPGDFGIGETTVTYTATDASNNIATGSFKITINDMEACKIMGISSDISQNTDASQPTAVVTWPLPTVTDNSGASITPTSMDDPGDPGDSFPIGDTTVTYTAMDPSNNPCMASFKITVTDMEACQIMDIPSDISQNTDDSQPTAVVTWTLPTVTDNSGAPITPTSVHDPGDPGDSFSIGETTVMYTAMDPSNNPCMASFKITVTDMEPCQIMGIPSDISQNTDTGKPTAVVTWTLPTVTDNSGASITLSSVHDPGDPGDSFPIGETTVMYTAMDPSGNPCMASFKITVTDNEDPVISGVPANVIKNIEVGQTSGVVSWTPPTASDNSGEVTLTSSHMPGDTFTLSGSPHTVTYTAVDPDGKTATTTFTVTIQESADVDPPVFSNTLQDIIVSTETGQSTVDVSWTPPTATDNSGADITPTSTHNPGYAFPIGITTVIYTATDPSDNSIMISFTVTILDEEACQVIGIPSDNTQTTDPGQPTAVVTWTPPTVTDNSGAVIIPTSVHDPGDSFGIGDTTVLYTAMDPSGNMCMASFTITVTDEEACQINGIPSDISQNNDPGQPTAVVTWTPPTVSDNSDAVITPTSVHDPGDPEDSFPIGETTVMYTAMDPSGNPCMASFKITVTDTVDPVINNIPSNIFENTDSGQATAVVTWTTPTVTDNSGATITPTSIYSPGSAFPIGETTVTYTAMDSSGNMVTESFIVTVRDDEDPVIIGIPSVINKDTDAGLATAAVTWTLPTATDNSGATITPTSTYSPGDTFPIGTTQVTYTATDPYDNEVFAWFYVIVTDNEDPVIPDIPSNIIQETDAGLPTAVVSWTLPTATDNSGEVITPESVYSPGDSFPIGITTVTYTATDSAGNEDVESFTITVEDKEDPVISGTPPNLIKNIEVGQTSGVVSWTPPTASDNSGEVTLTSIHMPGDTFTLSGSPHTVTYTAEDPDGNMATTMFTVTVQVSADVEPPVFSKTLPDITQNTDPGKSTAVVTWTPPTATDNSGVVITPTSTHDPGDTFPIGMTTVIYTAADPSGNSIMISFTVTILDAENCQIVDIPSDISQNTDAGEPTAVVTWTPPTATDNSGAAITPVSVHDPGEPGDPGNSFPIGDTTVTYSAMDPSGNPCMASFKITVKDAEDPVILNIPSDITRTTDHLQPTAVVDWPPVTAMDNSDAVITPTSNYSPGTPFPIGSTTVSYTAMDPSGNQIVESFTITVTDPEPPVISGTPSDMNVLKSVGSASISVTWVPPTATDNSGGEVTLISSHMPGGLFTTGRHEVTFTATDPSFNIAMTSFVITITDSDSPDSDKPIIIDVPSPIQRKTDPGRPTAVVTWSPQVTVSDNSPVTLISSHNSGEAFHIGTTTVLFIATDLYGNEARASFYVIVIDEEKPEIFDVPPDISKGSAPNSVFAIVNWTEPTARDNSGSVRLTYIKIYQRPSIGKRAASEVTDSFRIGTTLVTYTATDPSNNAATGSFTVTVTDEEIPTILNTPSNIITNTDPKQPTAIVTWSRPTANDYSVSYTLTSSHNPGTAYPIGITTVTYTARDFFDNVATTSFTITVIDAEVPDILNTPSSITETIDRNQTIAIVTWTPPTASDNSGRVTLTSSHTPGDSFPIGDTIVTYTATDPSNNTATTTFTIIVTTPLPIVLGLPANIIQNTDLNKPNAVVKWTQPTTRDNSERVTLTSSHNPGDTFDIGDTIVKYRATDLSGNVDAVYFTITVIDAEDPVISDTPSDIDRNTDPNESTTEVTWTQPTASDNSGLVTITSTYNPGDVFSIGTTTVTYMARDPYSNTATTSFIIRVTDKEIPIISDTPDDILRTTYKDTTVVTWASPTAADNSGKVTLTSSHKSGDIFNLGDTIVTYTATDPSSNIATTSFTVTVSAGAHNNISLIAAIALILGAVFAIVIVIALPACIWYNCCRKKGKLEYPLKFNGTECTPYNYPHPANSCQLTDVNRPPPGLSTISADHEKCVKNPLVKPTEKPNRIWEVRRGLTVSPNRKGY